MDFDETTQLPRDLATTSRIDLTTCATMSLSDAAHVLGIHRSTAWELYKKGEFPVPVLRIGRGLRVAKIQIERFLLTGESDPSPQQDRLIDDGA
ncbi:MAG: helix-turn-helix transcriptional regulator [Acidimicrobiales bacterium]